MLLCKPKKMKKIVSQWSAWWNIVSQMRPAFSRSSTFLWFAASLAAVCVRPDLRGVTSFVRALGLQQRCYERFLDLFHSSAVKLTVLRALWAVYRPHAAQIIPVHRQRAHRPAGRRHQGTHDRA